MAKFVAPGHLRIKDENLDLHPKSCLECQVQESKEERDCRSKSTQDLTKKTPPQTEASLPEKNLPNDIDTDEDVPWDECGFCDLHLSADELELVKLRERVHKLYEPSKGEIVLYTGDDGKLACKIEVSPSSEPWPEPDWNRLQWT